VANTGSGFTNLNAGLTGVDNGSAAWADYDNDGQLDILLTGSRALAGLPGCGGTRAMDSPTLMQD